jgi:hypothetical protein
MAADSAIAVAWLEMHDGPQTEAIASGSIEMDDGGGGDRGS